MTGVEGSAGAGAYPASVYSDRYLARLAAPAPMPSLQLARFNGAFAPK